jgi:hypothetical protein
MKKQDDDLGLSRYGLSVRAPDAASGGPTGPYPPEDARRMTMKSRIRSRIAAAVFASMTLLLSLSLVLTPARSAQKPSLLYATAEAGTKLIAISL